MTVWGVVLDFWVLDEVGGALEERFSWKPVLWIEVGFEPGWGTRGSSGSGGDTSSGETICDGL